MTRGSLLRHAIAQTALWAVLAVILVHIATAVPVRLDVTADQRHTLSPVTERTVAGLQQPLTATVWFTEDLGPPYHRHRQAVLDLLAELQAITPKLDVVVRDPTNDPELAKAATQAGIRPVTWAYRDATQTQARQVWMGVSFDHGEGHAAIDAVPSLERLEADLAAGIVSVTTASDDRKTVAWLVGNGEPSLAKWPETHPLGRLRTELSARTDLVQIDASAEPIPDRIDAVLIVGPQLAVPEETRRNLDAFLMRGGALAVFLTNHQPDFGAGRTRPVTHGLDALLETWGVSLGRELVIDRKSNEKLAVPLGDQWVQVSHPLAPASARFDRTQPPVRDLGRAVVPFASPLGLQDGVDGAVWLASGPSSSRIEGPAPLDVRPYQELLPGEVSGPVPLVVAAQGSFPSAWPDAGQRSGAPTRLVVAGSADMVANNPQLVLNAVDWLLGDPRLIAIRSRQAPTEWVPPDDPGRLKAAIAGGPMLLIALLAGLVAARRRR